MAATLKEIGENLKYLRKNKDVSQTTVAIDLGLSLTAYAKIEKGDTNLSFTRLVQLANYFKIDLAILISKKIISEFKDQNIHYPSAIEELKLEMSTLKEEINEIKRLLKPMRGETKYLKG